MSDRDELTAAAFLWEMLTTLRWDDGRDDPEDIELHQRSLAVARERWPWLDEAGEAYRAACEDGVTRAI